MIPQAFIQELLARLDIVDVVDQYLPLKKAGSNYVACCPFHNEKTPSFTVTQTKQFYHCFGCGAHGTAISFVMEYQGLGFVETVEQLATSIGLTVPQETVTAAARPAAVSPDLYALMSQACLYYRSQLKQAQPAIDYLKARGLTGQVAARFQLGFAPDNWQNLAAVFDDYQNQALLDAGLVTESESGRRYDRFRGRIIFPIINLRNQVIGFGGRVLPGEGEPKYLNSPETVLFEKGRELYGLYQAQKSIRARRQALVVEGYMDVVALVQHGVDHVVAALGTATTAHHLQKLFRMADQIVFCFDGDAAGQKAAWRAMENALPQLQDGKRINFLFLPAEHDPDSYIRQFGQEAFEALLDEAGTLSGFLLGQISHDLDLSQPEARSVLLQRAQPLLAQLQAPALSVMLRKEVASLAGISQEELERVLDLQTSAPRKMYRAPQKVSRMPLSSSRLLLQCLLAQPELIERLPQDWRGEGAEAEAIQALIDSQRDSEAILSTPGIMQRFYGTVHENLLASAEADMLSWGEDFDVEAEFEGVMQKLAMQHRQQQFERLQAKARQGLQALTAEEKEEYLQLLQR